MVDLEGSSSVFQLSDGQPRVVTIFRDVTARNRAEQAAQENALRWQVALDAAGDGLWDWKVETDEAFFSPTGIRMLGYEPSEIAARMEEWRSRVHPDDWPPIAAELERHLAGQTASFADDVQRAHRGAEQKG